MPCATKPVHTEMAALMNRRRSALFDKDEIARVLQLATQPDITDDDLLDLNACIMAAIRQGDWDAYHKLCDPDLSCFEPEAKGHLVTGMDYRQYCLDQSRSKAGSPDIAHQEHALFTNSFNSHVRWLCEGNAAMLTLKRVVQCGSAMVNVEESRLWEYSLVGAEIRFNIEGEERKMKVVRTSMSFDVDAPHDMTHLLEDPAGVHEPQWVCIDEDEEGNLRLSLEGGALAGQALPFEASPSGMWRMVHFNRSELE